MNLSQNREKSYRERACRKVVIMPGPSPKAPTKRRNRGTPKSWGAAQPTTVPAAPAVDRELGFDAHPLVVSMWDSLQDSAESRFYSAADWQRARLELWNVNEIMRSGKPISGRAWTVVQHGLNDLLVSPAEKRRVAIEVRPSGPDADENAAVAMIDRYRQKLKPV
jgi:hypothetical protein